MFWLVGGVIAALVLYNGILWAAATHDLENDRQHSGRERWKRFFLHGGPWWPF